jgi:hypothetical protein
MVPNLPMSINLFFMLITFITAGLFLKATNYSKPVLIITIMWLLLQIFISVSGFYTRINTVPPRFAFLAVPPVVLIAVVFATAKGRRFVDTINLKTLTLLHTIRIFVELTLLMLYLHKLVPQLMTIEGRNFDILSGITAPLVFYFVFVQHKLGRKALLAWNFICLALLLNIVINAVLSIPSLFQKFAFEQPNIAVLYFPFVWLPSCVVPVVLFAHLAAIKQLLNKNKSGDKLRVTVINTQQKVR